MGSPLCDDAHPGPGFRTGCLGVRGILTAGRVCGLEHQLTHVYVLLDLTVFALLFDLVNINFAWLCVWFSVVPGLITSFVYKVLAERGLAHHGGRRAQAQWSLQPALKLGEQQEEDFGFFLDLAGTLLLESSVSRTIWGVTVLSFPGESADVRNPESHLLRRMGGVPTGYLGSVS